LLPLAIEFWPTLAGAFYNKGSPTHALVFSGDVQPLGLLPFSIRPLPMVSTSLTTTACNNYLRQCTNQFLSAIFLDFSYNFGLRHWGSRKRTHLVNKVKTVSLENSICTYCLLARPSSYEPRAPISFGVQPIRHHQKCVCGEIAASALTATWKVDDALWCGLTVDYTIRWYRWV